MPDNKKLLSLIWIKGRFDTSKYLVQIKLPLDRNIVVDLTADGTKIKKKRGIDSITLRCGAKLERVGVSFGSGL